MSDWIVWVKIIGDGVELDPPIFEEPPTDANYTTNRATATVINKTGVQQWQQMVLSLRKFNPRMEDSGVENLLMPKPVAPPKND